MDQTLRILLLEDSPIDVELIKYELKKSSLNFELRQVNNKTQFLQELESFQPQVVLSDFTLPQYTGLEALQDAQNLDPTLIFIIVTGTLDEETAVECMKNGASDYVLKSSLVRLSPSIQAALQKHHSEQQRELVQRALQENEAKYKTLIEHAPDAIMMLDFDQRRFVEVNQKAIQLFELPREELLELNLSKALNLSNPDGGGSEAIERLLQSTLEGATPTFEWTYHKPTGEVLTCEIRLVALPYQNRRLIRSSITDISARKEAEAKLLHDAFHDTLTGLPNRPLFMKRLSQSIRSIKEGTLQAFATFLLDLDRFQMVNDSLGHTTGDQFLIQIASRLRDILPDNVTLARLGGDEFVVLLHGTNSHEQAEQLARHIQSQLVHPFHLGGKELFTSVSIGIVLSKREYEKPEEVLRDADTALNQAKGRGRNRFEIFTPPMHVNAVVFFQMATAIRQAIKREEFTLHYQPQLCLKTQTIVGFEALLRWQHPQNGLISPTKFIPVAEELNLILELGEWVMHQACKQTKRWHEAGFEHLKVSVNCSPRQFQEGNLPSVVERALQDSQLPARSLELELTESIVMGHEEEAIATLDALHDIGIQLAIDDFGTGYSSLSYLKRFPIHSLKIDRTFIKDLCTNSQDAAITKAVIQLAQALSLRVVAEGVEEKEQYELLRQNNCDQIQGFFLSRPMPVDQTLPFLQEFNSSNPEHPKYLPPPPAK